MKVWQKPQQFDYDRIPPQSRESEEAVLGAMMLEKSVAYKLTLLLTPDQFYFPNNGEIFRAMVTLQKEETPIDILTVNNELRNMGKLQDVGGAHYLAKLNRRTPSAENVEFYARIIIEAAIKREVISQANAMLRSAYDETTDAFEIVESAGTAINAIIEKQIANSGPRHVAIVMQKLSAEVERLAALKPNEIPGIATGIFDFDKAIGGLQPTNFYVWAARPGMGKTAFLMNVAYHATRNGVKTGIVSLEMSDVQLLSRAISDTANVHALKFRDGGFQGEDIPRIAKAIQDTSKLSLYVDDTPALTLQQIQTRARLLHRREKIQVLFVDYLQLISNSGTEGTKAAEVTAIARGLKNLAKELNIPVVALAQVNRGTESRPDHRPQLSDLKESGGIEEAADHVMFIHRPEYYGETIDENNNSTKGVAELIIKKQRNGPLCTVRCNFVAEFVRFQDSWKIGEANIASPWEQVREF
mgnify:CR=1 FL=1